MTIFNSKPINTDPNPYELVNLSGSVIGRVNKPTEALLLEDRYRPRPEYDNNVNPLLVWFRATNRDDMHGWGKWLAFASRSLKAQGLATEAHFQHALRVLSRIADLADSGTKDAA